jgi:hypothetical protein
MLTGRHAVMPAAPADDAPDISDDTGMLSVTVGSGRPASLVLGGTAARQSAQAYDALMLPETKRYTVGANATLSESFGRVSLSQSGTWQTARDQINPALNTTTYTATANGNGSIGTFFTLAAMANGTRTTADPTLGNTDMLVLTAQPMVQVARAGLSVAGNLMYTKTKNTTQLLDSTVEQYGGLVSWNHARTRWTAALQLSVDWTRMRDAVTIDPRFVRRIGGALTVAWTMSHGDAGAPSILPPPPAASPGTVAGLTAPGRIASLLSQLRASALSPRGTASPLR